MKITLGFKTVSIIIAVAIISVMGAWYISGYFVRTDGLQIIGNTVGNFNIVNRDVCFEDGKPVVYFFGHTSCPHCRWEHPIVVDVAKDFEGYISFHDNFDKDADSEVFKSYSSINPGYIPFTVIGCKYIRVGSGEQIGEAADRAAMTSLMCELTENKPAVCS